MGIPRTAEGRRHRKHCDDCKHLGCTSHDMSESVVYPPIFTAISTGNGMRNHQFLHMLGCHIFGMPYFVDFLKPSIFTNPDTSSYFCTGSPPYLREATPFRAGDNRSTSAGVSYISSTAGRVASTCFYRLRMPRRLLNYYKLD